MNTAKPLTICPLPAEGTRRLLEQMTEENNHTAARSVACAWLDDAWRGMHEDEAGLSPFGPLRAAFDRLEVQHEKAGHISPALLKLRAALWMQARAVAEDEGMHAAAVAIANCL